MKKYLIRNVHIVNEGTTFTSDVLIEDKKIAKIAPNISVDFAVEEINGDGKYLLPGVIDDQVHFREPGLTHKANIYTESRAAVAGGVTSFMEMPNTNPPTFTHDLLEEKYNIAQRTSLANYSFYIGTANDNLEEILKTNDKKNDICGIKIFMGSSTGNLLVDNPIVLEKVFAGSELLIATHCEEESIIKRNYEHLSAIKTLEPADHAIIRDEENCFTSSLKAVQYAKKYGSRLHILHISTAKELDLLTNMLPLEDKKITAEVCVHHLHFTADDYASKGYQLKCNPAIKAPHHRDRLWEALLDDRLDVIATDHAPHQIQEKGFERIGGQLVRNEKAGYNDAHAGLPLVQHSLQVMLYYVHQGKISIEKVVEKMSHNVAKCFQIKNRGFIKEGYYADLVLVDMQQKHSVTPSNIYSKCAWSPFEQFVFPASIEATFVNGYMAYANNTFNEAQLGERLKFDR